MNRIIKKVAVLGSGVMGSRIACHFANIGVNVLLFDIPNKIESKPAAKNKIVNDALQNVLKSAPSPIYKKEFAKRITTGNFEDDFQEISDCDWVIEAVVENLQIKKNIFEQVEKFRKPETLITSNTSGIPINLLEEGRSDDFQKHFCGTHFFNPPRYLPLLEIIPTQKTSKEVINFLMYFGDLHLGKTMVQCNDTPAFIANRIGIFSIMAIFHLMKKMDLSIDEIDLLTGPIVGRPKSATFRTCDLVGIDTLVKVANDLYKFCVNDEAREFFKVPDFVNKMIENKWFGDKTGQGFYKKVKTPHPKSLSNLSRTEGREGEGLGESKTEILTLNIKTLEYEPKQKIKFSFLETIKPIENLKERLKAFSQINGKAGDFFREFYFDLFTYVSHRIPEIADEIYKVDDALCAGFGWEIGPFEIWDILVETQNFVPLLTEIEAGGRKPADWIYEMQKNGAKSFYKIENGKRKFYDIPTKSYKEIPGKNSFIILEDHRSNVIWKNSGCDLIDLGDGILNLEFHTKMNTIGGEVVEGINKSIDLAEKNFRGLVIGNDGPNFSAGANLALVFMWATNQEFDEIDSAIRTFQKTAMRIRYSSIPVVAAPHGLTLGGGCELTLHADKVQAAAETYIGLVEFGVGLIPGGGGTKEMTLRASERYLVGDIELNSYRENFLTIGMAKVSTSAHEAFDMGILKIGHDEISINQNRLIADAKKSVINLSEAGYISPQPKEIKVQGRTTLAMFLTGANAMFRGNYISEHDKKISKKLAFVMSGGDLSAPSFVSEQYLLDLEREAFLSLLGEKKTLERIQSLLTKGKILRN